MARPYDVKNKKFRTSLTVDETRRTRHFFGHTAGSDGWRIAIVDSADDMNPNAANAILKILEEPPARSVFFILSHAAGSLLPTIRSRCQLLPLSPLSSDEIAAALTLQGLGEGLSNDDFARVAELAEGSVRQAIQLVKSGGLSIDRELRTLLNANEPDWTRIHPLAERISPRNEEDAYRLFIDLVFKYLGDQVRPKDAAARGANALVRWPKVWEKTTRTVAQADGFNLDRKEVVLSIFQSIFEAGR